MDDHPARPCLACRRSRLLEPDRLPGAGLSEDTVGVSILDVAVGLMALWLVLVVLTAAGARRRGHRWHLTLLSGLLFPVIWVAWYVADSRLERKGRRITG